MIQSLTAYLFFINCKIILWQKEPKVILSRSVTDQKWNLKSTTPMYCSPFSSQKCSFWSPAHIVLQVSKAFVDYFFYIFVYNVVIVVLPKLARPCFLFHKTVLNECAISIRGKFTMKIWPKYILRKWIHRFIQSTQILLPSTAQGSEVWENTDQVNTNQNARIYLRTTLPYDIPV